MKLIHKFKSPNFDERKSKKISFIIIHYTALKSVSKSINFLCLKKNQVSAHYVISRNGEIYSLVSEKKRAWHAGDSYWNGIKDINSYSIGIELDYSANNLNEEYAEKQIKSLLKLLLKIKEKYSLNSKNILGHSDMLHIEK
jgi:Negative regulator of beta-lactamase expression